MKLILKENDKYILRFDSEENLIDKLKEFSNLQNITSAHFTAIGAASNLTLSYFNLNSKLYEDHSIMEDVEIVNITGNISSLNGELTIHMHGMFAKNDLSTIGGHIKKIIISATCEVILERLNSKLTRMKDEQAGLNLLI